MIERAGQLTVRPVESRRSWNEFFDLRRLIYRDNRNVVFPLRFMERTMLDPDKHPFYLHATRQAYVAYRNGRPVGRIVAIKNDLHNEFYQDRVGFFGFFECLNDLDAAAELFKSAGGWLREQGCESVRGPVNPSMKSDFGVQVKGNDDPPFVMMAFNPDYYEKLLLDNGFQAIREFNAYLYDVDSTYDIAKERDTELLGATDRILDRYPKLRIGSVERADIDATLREINRIGNEIRQSGWGFVPLTDAELDFMIKQLKQVLVPRMILVAYWDDKLVGYCVNVPDVNWALRRSWGRYDWMRLPQFLFWLPRTQRSRVIALGADPAYRRRGVGILLSIEMRTRGLASLNYRQWEFSWIDSQNDASIKATGRTMPLDHYKTYRLYEKTLIGS